jgi:hypothetical protein
MFIEVLRRNLNISFLAKIKLVLTSRGTDRAFIPQKYLKIAAWLTK